MNRLPVILLLLTTLLSACGSSETASSDTSKVTSKVTSRATTDASAASQEKIVLRLAHSWPKGFPIFAESVDDYVKLVAEMSDNRIQISVDSNNKHKAANGILDFVKSGQYDLGQTAAYYYGGKDPDTLYFASMPFSMTNEEQTAWFYKGGGLELANEVFAKHNIEVMLGGNTGIQMGGWFRKEINSVDDLKGLKIRMPGFGGKVMAGVGAISTNIAAGELYQALERGTIDALEWVGPGLDLRMGFHKIAPYYYSGWHEPGTELLYFFNKEKMATLPDWAQSILRNAAKLTAHTMSNDMFDANAENWDVISSKFPNVKVKQFPPDVIDALKKSNQQLLASEMARSPSTKKIIESRAEYLRKARAWTDIGLKLYLDSIATNPESDTQ